MCFPDTSKVPRRVINLSERCMSGRIPILYFINRVNCITWDSKTTDLVLQCLPETYLCYQFLLHAVLVHKFWKLVLVKFIVRKFWFTQTVYFTLLYKFIILYCKDNFTVVEPGKCFYQHCYHVPVSTSVLYKNFVKGELSLKIKWRHCLASITC